MVRFTIRKRLGSCNHPEVVTYLTIEADVPELEEKLRAGGRSQYGYELYDVIGCSAVEHEKPTRDVKEK